MAGAVLITTEVDVARLPGELLSEVRKRVSRGMATAAAAVVPEVRRTVQQGIVSSPEYSSLLAGKLRGEFGLAEPKAALDSIVRAVGASVQSRVLTGSGEFLGGLVVQAIRSDFRDALSADGASYTSVNKAGGASAVDWLEWLLFAGDTVVIGDYGVAVGNFEKFSRTGTHLMLRAKEKGRVQPWRVPPEFSGTEGGNWLTRVADAVAPDVMAAVDRELRRIFT